MTPDEIDRIISEAAARIPTDDGGSSAARAEAAILKDLRPVRRLPSPWVFTWTFVALFAVFAVGSASILGLAGWHALSLAEGLPIFEALLATALLASFACARQMYPASGRSFGFSALILPVVLLPLVFALVFRDYSTAHLVQEGVPCLEAGLRVAIPTAISIALVLRLGFVMDWSAAGLTAGALGGLAGLSMLELNCPNTKVFHVITWHVAVVVCSSALAFGVGWIADWYRTRRRPSIG